MTRLMSSDDRKLLWNRTRFGHWRIWGDQATLFDNASGDTHLLHGCAVAVLDVLTQAEFPMGAAELESRVAQACNWEAGTVEAALTALCQLEMVCTHEPSATCHRPN
ncbi:MAG: HPr-rel-A system PqqD family peptide chaperone [Pseudomonadota bacterium]|nr:HPr-rel-A system PqqD family peptide chaperone [Pseudomonadota bacterium]